MPRYSAGFPVQLKLPDTGEAHDGTCLNLSEGGVLVESELALHRGASVYVEMVIPSVGRAFYADAEVMWAVRKLPGRGGPGMGLRFTEIQPVHLSFLRDLIRKLDEPGRQV